VHVLLVEDDPTIAEPLIRALHREGFTVHHVTSGAGAIDAAPVDIVLLDLGLPDLDGIVVCRELRRRSEDTAIIVITARAAEMDRVTLLELGADDYLVKPFGFRELVARMRAVLRRSAPKADAGDVLRCGPVEIDRRGRTVIVDGAPIHLTPKEYDLLVHLAVAPGTVRTRDEILREVWDEHWFGSSKTLDVHMASLRRKLGRPDLIETVRGVGFRLAS
jgi:two-component system response regulator RegX3